VAGRASGAAAALQRASARPSGEAAVRGVWRLFGGPKNRLLCSRRCKDRRYARLHPEALREKKQRYFRRRRECKSPSSSGFLVVAVGELAVMGRPPASTARAMLFGAICGLALTAVRKASTRADTTTVQSMIGVFPGPSPAVRTGRNSSLAC